MWSMHFYCIYTRICFNYCDGVWIMTCGSSLGNRCTVNNSENRSCNQAIKNIRCSNWSDKWKLHSLRQWGYFMLIKCSNRQSNGLFKFVSLFVCEIANEYRERSYKWFPFINFVSMIFIGIFWANSQKWYFSN